MTKTNMTFIPHTPYCLTWPTVTFLFSQVKIKLKGCHFGTMEVIQVELQAVLNTLAEQDFQEAFKKKAEALGTVHTRRNGHFNGDGGK
jgi:hypothetical protein